MEENQSGTSQTVQTPSSDVSFPGAPAPKKSGGAKTLLILGALVLIGILGFAIFKSATKKASTSAEATPISGLSGEGTVSVSTPAPSPTPSSSDRSGVSIEIQNGTGIAGEAAYLQTQLGGLGYSNIKVGNADQRVTVTEVTFANSVSQAVVDEIVQKLKSIYENVSSTTSSSAESGVVIVTGLRKGATALPSPTETPTASPEATPTTNP